MKLIQVRFDESQQPEEFTVQMGRDELALLYRLSSHVAPRVITDLTGDVRWGQALFDLADSAAGFLNMFFDDGANSLVPRFKVLAVS